MNTATFHRSFKSGATCELIVDLDALKLINHEPVMGIVVGGSDTLRKAAAVLEAFEMNMFRLNWNAKPLKSDFSEIRAWLEVVQRVLVGCAELDDDEARKFSVKLADLL